MTSGDEEPAGDHARPDVRNLCPHCGAVCEPDQEYCLSCGERLFETGIPVTSLAESWRRALPFADKSWAWPVLIALIVAILASSVAIAVTVTRSSHTKTLQELGPSVPQTTTTLATTSGETSTGSGTTTPTTTNKPPTPPIHSAGLIAWPGPPAYTVILASLPVQDGKEGPRQKALKALNAGLGDVGVLKSSNFSSLHANYYVVFSGVFKSQSAALARLPAARAAGFDSPYPKRVVP